MLVRIFSLRFGTLVATSGAASWWTPDLFGSMRYSLVFRSPNSNPLRQWSEVHRKRKGWGFGTRPQNWQPLPFLLSLPLKLFIFLFLFYILLLLYRWDQSPCVSITSLCPLSFSLFSQLVCRSWSESSHRAENATLRRFPFLLLLSNYSILTFHTLKTQALLHIN